MFSIYISRTWWEVLKNQFKNFVKLYHEELSNKAWSMWQHHIPQNIFFWQQDSLLLTGPEIYPQIYDRTPCPAALICKGFRWDFSCLMTTKCPCGWSQNVLLLLAPSKKHFSLPFTLAKKRTYLDTQSKRELTDLFWKLPGCSLFLQAEQE